MQTNHTISTALFQMRCQWRQIVLRLRQERVALALLVLLTLGVGEPLLCIVHCYFWMPDVTTLAVAVDQNHLHGHDHAHMHHSGGAATTAVADAPTCAIGMPMSGSIPWQVQPVPVHEVVPALAILLLIPLLMTILPVAAPGDAPSIFLPPRLRPPISSYT